MKNDFRRPLASRDSTSSGLCEPRKLSVGVLFAGNKLIFLPIHKRSADKVEFDE
jgi:hypothetical protein